MNKSFVIGLISGVIVSGALAVNAMETKTSIQACSALLPSGHTFELSIEGNIDTRAALPTVSGNISLSEHSIEDGAQIEPQIMPFVKCVNHLVK